MRVGRRITYGPGLARVLPRPPDPYRQRLYDEAFRTFNPSAVQNIRACVELPDLARTIPAGIQRAVQTAVAHDLWVVDWDSLAHVFGYKNRDSAQVSVNRIAKTENGWNAMAVAESIVARLVLDEHLELHAEIVEQVEMLAEVGWLEKTFDGDGMPRYGRPA